MSSIRYTEDHEWLRLEDGEAVCGITDFAQEQLGDIVFVELPDVGRQVAAGDEVAVVESVKAASEVYAPLAGEVIAVNDALTDNPAMVNEDAAGSGWFFRLKLADPAAADSLMDEAAYKAFIEASA